MIKRLPTILIALLTLLCGAQCAVAARPVVDRAVDAIGSAPSLTATFRVNGADGRLVMSGDRFKLEVPGMKTAFDGTTQWTLNETDAELTITEPTPEEVAAINPLGFIGSLRAQFKATTLADGRVRFTPSAPGSDVSEIVAAFDKNSAMPVLISMKAAGGEMLIDGIKVTRSSKPVPASQFIIKPSVDVTIIDLR